VAIDIQEGLDGAEDIFSNAGFVIYITIWAHAHLMLMLIKPRIRIRKIITSQTQCTQEAVAYEDSTQSRMLS
jgi:hypothetical protein